MSEFIAFLAKKKFDIGRNVSLSKIGSNEVLERARQALFPYSDPSEAYTINYEGSDFDGLFTDAQHDVNRNIDISKTLLFDVISTILYNSNEVALWYGSDYTDLDVVATRDDFFKYIMRSFSDGTAECYVRYSRI